MYKKHMQKTQVIGSKTFYNCREYWKIALSQGRLPQVYGTCKADVIIPYDVKIDYDPLYNQCCAPKMTLGKMIANGTHECISGRCYSQTFQPNHTYDFDIERSVARFDKN
jgi:hypothetical protein